MEKQIINYLKNHEDLLIECLEELDKITGYLEDDRYFEMDLLNDFFTDSEPEEIFNRAFFGHDAETTFTDCHGITHKMPFNPTRDYFKFDGYGNIVSSNHKDYSLIIDGYTVEELNENRQFINAIDSDETLKELFDNL